MTKVKCVCIVLHITPSLLEKGNINILKITTHSKLTFHGI